jgi:hypothetical protein
MPASAMELAITSLLLAVATAICVTCIWKPQRTPATSCAAGKTSGVFCVQSQRVFVLSELLPIILCAALPYSVPYCVAYRARHHPRSRSMRYPKVTGPIPIWCIFFYADFRVPISNRFLPKRRASIDHAPGPSIASPAARTTSKM